MRVERERIRLSAELEQALAERDLVFPSSVPLFHSDTPDESQVSRKRGWFVVRRLRRARHISPLVFYIDEDWIRYC